MSNVFIMNEVLNSMLLSLNLAYLHLHLEEVFGTDNWSGSISILFVGDLLQLPPDNGAPVLDKLNTKAVLSKLGCMTFMNIWKETVVYDELTLNEHQKKDTQFCELLDEVRRECVSEKCIKILHGRETYPGPNADKFEELMQSGESLVCLFPTRKACEEFNITMRYSTSCSARLSKLDALMKWTTPSACTNGAKRKQRS